MKNCLVTFWLVLPLFLSGCGKRVDQPTIDLPTQLSNSLGDVMASIDEAGKGNQTITQYIPSSLMKTPATQTASQKAFEFLLPKAEAATCGIADFSACVSNQVTRTFNGCTVGGYQLAGTVQMAWSGGTNCTLATTGQNIHIVPNYSVSTESATLNVTKSGSIGILLTWISGAGASQVFQYSNDGIHRVISSGNTVLFDITTKTSGNITVTGDARGGATPRSMSGGGITVTNGVNLETCNFTIGSALSWGLTNCNCPTSGSWTGSCTDTGAYTVSITACGAGTVSYVDGGVNKSEAIAFDRCVAN